MDKEHFKQELKYWMICNNKTYKNSIHDQNAYDDFLHWQWESSKKEGRLNEWFKMQDSNPSELFIS